MPIRTSGDGGNREVLGSFVKEIQEALLDHRVDVALHCLKDLPTRPVDGLKIGAYLKREDPTDALISHADGWSQLPHGAVVGTGSVRRTSQLAAIRPDLQFKPLVGNVDTRMRKLQERIYDAIVLATAGLTRLGVMEHWDTSEYANLHVEPLPILPAAGQAILVLEVRNGTPILNLIESFNDDATQRASIAERAFLNFFGTGCSMPVAAHAKIDGEKLTLDGLVASPDGVRVLRSTESGDGVDAAGIGVRLADRLCADGARELLPEGIA